MVTTLPPRLSCDAASIERTMSTAEKLHEIAACVFIFLPVALYVSTPFVALLLWTGFRQMYQSFL